MGDERFNRYLEMRNSVQSEEQINQVYDLFRDLYEANLMRSLDPDVTFDTSYRLYQTCAPCLSAGTRVLELGCWSGGLASFLAMNHPECTVIGVDRARRILEAASAHYSLPNLSFLAWDYRSEQNPERLERCHVLLCGLGINNSPDGPYDLLHINAVRESPGYVAHRQEMLGYFKNWRNVATDGAMLLAILRITSFVRYLATADASTEAGWTHLAGNSARVNIKEIKGGGSIPMLAFVANASPQVTEDEALAAWIGIRTSSHEYATFDGPLALGVYRALAAKQPLTLREFVNAGGHPTKQVVGVSGPLGYVFAQDAKPNYQLHLISLMAAMGDEVRFRQKMDENLREGKHPYAGLCADCVSDE